MKSDSIGDAKEAVFVDSAPVSKDAVEVKGIDWDGKIPDLIKFANSLLASGFQATQISRASNEIRRMLSWRPSSPSEVEEFKESEEQLVNSSFKCCTIWLSFTSNMISSGLREIFVYLAKNKLVDVFVTSAGGIEEDFIKCLSPTYLGDFGLDGKSLRQKGWNRIGNLLVPNKNYCEFEDWLQPLLDECLNKQNQDGYKWTPSKLIKFLGEKINNESSLYYWCYKNNIPVFCPGLTDGSLGDNLYFHSYRNPGLIIDVIEDIRRINDIALKAKKSGIVILGGGIAKHHTCNANLMRNGADFAVYISTAQEFDGSDSGARPDEAVSWGKITAEATPIKVHCDATIAFPLVFASSFLEFNINRLMKEKTSASADTL